MTNVVVHERGVPRFVRMLLVGGSDVTDAIAGELDVDVDTAEDLKRRAHDGASDDLEADELAIRAARIAADRLTPLVEEVRGSLDYHLAQPEAAAVGRVLLTGGASRSRGLGDRLHDQLRLPVETGHPLASVRVGHTGLSAERLAAAEPLLAVSVGLALAARPVESGQRRLSLLPREVEAVRAQRRQGLLVVAAVVMLAVLLGVLWVARGSRVSRERKHANQAEAKVVQLRQQLGSLLHEYSLVRTATWLFGGLYIGIQLPLTAQTQETWDWTRSLAGRARPGSWGGHAVNVVGYDARGLTVVTWDQVKRLTWSFWDRYVDECYCILSKDFLERGQAPNGFYLAALEADLALVTA